MKKNEIKIKEDFNNYFSQFLFSFKNKLKEDEIVSFEELLNIYNGIKECSNFLIEIKKKEYSKKELYINAYEEESLND